MSMLIVPLVLTGILAYVAVGAKQARKIYVECHRKWFDEKIREHRLAVAKRNRVLDPEALLILLRKDWENKPGAQGEAMALAMMMFLVWPVFWPLFALGRNPEPRGEEAKLVNASLEAEVERLRRQVEEGR